VKVLKTFDAGKMKKKARALFVNIRCGLCIIVNCDRMREDRYYPPEELVIRVGKPLSCLPLQELNTPTTLWKKINPTRSGRFVVGFPIFL